MQNLADCSVGLMNYRRSDLCNKGSSEDLTTLL